MHSLKIRQKPQGGVAAFMLGAIYAGIFLALLFLLAFGYEKELLQQGRERGICDILLGIVSFLCAFTAGRRANHRKMVISIISVSLLTFLLIGIGVFTKGFLLSNISFWTGVLIVIFGGILGGICASMKKNRF